MANISSPGFALHKSTFQDALALRSYGWLLLRTPTSALHVLVEHLFLLNMLYLVLKVSYFLFNTMK